MDDRETYTKLILDSQHTKKLIVAGAGTGKTFTFKQLLEKNKGQNNLVLTFINQLVYDLDKELKNVANVKTFHAFSRNVLHQLSSINGLNKDFDYYPNLENIIIEDAFLLQTTKVSRSKVKARVSKSIKNLIQDHCLEFYIERANFYNAVGFDDSVYRAILAFQANMDFIPTHNFIIVDEYQDFNKLEVSFLDLLCTKSEKIIIAGDDDQSLYSFKHASPQYLREKSKNNEYVTFNLPFCSRCTDVIVRTVNDIISRASASNILGNRIDKSYKCHMASKNKDNLNYPNIKNVNISTNTQRCPFIAKYILSELEKLSQDEIKEAQHNYPLALIIGPSQYLEQIFKSLEKLSNKYEIEYESKMKTQKPTLLEGLVHLSKNEKSNLAWRIILGSKCTDSSLKKILKKSKQLKKPLIEVISKEDSEYYLRLYSKLNIELNNTNDEKNTNNDSELIKLCGKDYLLKYKKILGRDEIINLQSIEMENEEKKPIIKLVTFPGSKGLSGGQVFILGFEEGIFPKKEPTFDEVCQFIVSLTRTRKQCHLIHVKYNMAKFWEKSSFINWIPKENMQQLTINKEYFNKN
ncbi:UvrD-helicase domain-containing protein [Legionella sainthelensi]|uniref:UvrD-helicase domain-containing protein n=1 Tax=Legionella sainthelensi TaxID=28087 RepID=UPI000E2035F2|nr:UvrD-helicase domain-containing protein [Legionella sainthelensi]